MNELKEDIRNLSPDRLQELFVEWGEPSYRARQLFRWLNQKDLQEFSRMTDFPKRLISELEKRFFIGTLECLDTKSGREGTMKFLWGLEDSHSIETVFIPEKKRRTLCLSTQVGCRFRCPFCVSGSKGFIRNLSVSEIIGQVLGVRKIISEDVTNIVLMGIGEALDNFDNVIKAIHVLNHPHGLRIGARKITLSTCGLVPQILRLKQLGIQVELAVSLHATTNELRNMLVPVNRKYPLEMLLPACREYSEATGRVITFEFALIDEVNDSLEEARQLGDLARRLAAKVNLISCSPNMSPHFKGTSEKKTKDFQKVVRSKAVSVTIRQTKGDDILAACGQLAFDR